MTLEKAIEIKESRLQGNQCYNLDDVDEADRLLIEAGKRIIAQRRQYPEISSLPLPRETKE